MISVHDPRNPEFHAAGNNQDAALASKKLEINPEAPIEAGQASAIAQKMVIAARENVRFLNRQLACHEKWLALPPLTDGAFYLAYIVRVKADAPFTAHDLRSFLDENGIETTLEFDFYRRPETGLAFTKRLNHKKFTETGFCLPCHYRLAIPDLVKITAVIDHFLRTRLPETVR